MKNYKYCLFFLFAALNLPIIGQAKTVLQGTPFSTMHTFLGGSSLHQSASAESQDEPGITLTGGDGNVRYMKMAFYDNTACTGNPVSTGSISDNSAGFPFTSGETVRFNAQSVYELANKPGVTTDNIQCMKVFLDGGHASSNGASCQTFNDLTCANGSCHSNETKTANWGANPSLCNARYIYMTTDENLVGACKISASGGAVSNCTNIQENTSVSAEPGEEGLTTNNGYLYLSNGNELVTVCRLNSNNTLSDCKLTGDQAHLRSAGELEVNDGFFYSMPYAGPNTGKVSVCSINPSDGTLSNCSFLNNMTGIGSLSINNGYAYVSTEESSGLTICKIDPKDGTFNSCKNGGVGRAVEGASIYNNHIYITLFAVNLLETCALNKTDGSLASCDLYHPAIGYGLGLIFNSGFAHFVEGGSDPSKICKVDPSNAKVTTCVNANYGDLVTGCESSIY